MIPESEMWKVICSAKAYRCVIISNQLRAIAKRTIKNQLEPIASNSDPTLDDTVDFESAHYKVEALLSEMEMNSPVGSRFAEEVYTHAQSNSHKKPISLGIFNYSDAVYQIINPETK